jgi:hypothetical protein
MKKWMAALTTCLALSTLPMGAFAHGYDAGDAALGGFVGGVVGGLIGAGGVPIVAAPVVVAPAPVVVERYAPRTVVVERRAPVVVERRAYYRGGHPVWRDRAWHRHEWREHERHEHRGRH